MSALLSLQGYGVSYGRRVVLASVDLSLSEEGLTVLMGPVKAGKSSLMRSLAGLSSGNRMYRQWGAALLNGQALGDGLRPLLVVQHAQIMNMPVRDALVFHRARVDEQLRSPAGRDEFARSQLQAYGLSHLCDALDEHVLSLPVVQQRMVNILSHALAKPPLLMVDEPTFGLDELSAEALVQWLSGLGKQLPLLVALHHQGQARRLADRIILLGGGRILADEPVARFFSTPVNAWVEQFVRTGSLYIASPDAQPQELSPDVEPPPPLPDAARAAIAEFLEPGPAEVPALAPAPAAAAVPPPSPSASGWVVLSQSAVQGPVVVAVDEPMAVESTPASAHAEVERAPEVTPVAAGGSTASKAAPPPTSRRGVIDASLVGKALPSANKGPAGFNWVIYDKLSGCAEPGLINPIDYDLDLLRRCGITYLITLTEHNLDQAALKRHGLANLHLPIFDREAPSLAQAYMLVYKMQQLLDQQHVLAVHCKAGIGRTGTLLACWLIREGGLTAEDAIARLRAINPRYVQTVVQEEFLSRLEQDILMRLN